MLAFWPAIHWSIRLLATFITFADWNSRPNENSPKKVRRRAKVCDETNEFASFGPPWLSHIFLQWMQPMLLALLGRLRNIWVPNASPKHEARTGWIHPE